MFDNRRHGAQEAAYHHHRASALPDPLQELEDLGAAINAPQAQPQPATNDLDDLESLFSEAMAGAREVAEARTARERIKRGGQTAAERAADAERIKAWEAKHEWIAQANVAAFEEIVCTTCDTAHRVFTGLMQRQKHRTQGHGAMRWQAQAQATAGLPNEVAIRRVERVMCEDCAPGFGWPLDVWTEWV
jgi:hypothetical protein